MKILEFPYGKTYLLTEGESEFDAGRFFLQVDEFGQFFATEKSTGREIHVPRTTAIASKTIEASRFSNFATKFGNEIHERIQNGEKNAYSRPFDFQKALYKEIRFVHVGKCGIFTGTVDAVFPKFLVDIKTGKESSHYFWQVLGYAYAMGLKQAHLSFFDVEKKANKVVSYLYLDENFPQWEEKVKEWVHLYNAAGSFPEKEKILVRLGEKEEEQTLEDAKTLAKLKSLQRLVNEAVSREEEKTKDSLKMILTGKRLEIWDTLSEERVEFSTSKSGILACRGKFDLDLEEIKKLLFPNWEGEIYGEVAQVQ